MDQQSAVENYYSSERIALLLTLKADLRLPFRQLAGFAESVFAMTGGVLGSTELHTDMIHNSGQSEQLYPVKAPLGISEKLKNGKSILLTVDSSELKIYNECEQEVRKHSQVITEEAKAKMHSSDGKPYWENKCTFENLKTKKRRLKLRLRC